MSYATPLQQTDPVSQQAPAPTPCEEMPHGLYLVSQHNAAKGVDHYGVVDIGNRLANSLHDGTSPILIHQTPPSIRMDVFAGTWKSLGKITDEAGAIARINLALEDPRYDLFGHNCEHFARFVATGRRESTQLQATVAVVGGIAAFFWVIATLDEAA
jgi:hypothetical protein